MAKPKQEVLVKKLVGIDHLLRVYCDAKAAAVKDIRSVEGVLGIFLSSIAGYISVEVDPRYDTDEVAKEIEELLLAEVPEAFRDS